MKQILLRQGVYTQVSDQDYNDLNKYVWEVAVGANTLYAVRYIGQGKNKITVPMHRQIMNVLDSELLIDHADRNGLNNQRENLREATYSQNSANRGKRPNTKSKHIGIYPASHGRFRATIQRKTGTITERFTEVFENEISAINWRNIKAKELYGDFAVLN